VVVTDGRGAGAGQEPGHACTVLVADTRDCRPEDAALLDAVETARAGQLTPAAHRARFVTGAALLRRALARELGVGPRDVAIDRTCPDCGRPHGRPRVPGSGVHVSVSHAGTTVLVALTAAGEVGVDVEPRTRRLAPGLAPTILAPSEEVTSPEALLTYWCRKESVVKATGDGLRVPLRDVVTSRVGTAPRLLSYQGRQVPAQLSDLDLPRGLVGALTVLTDRAVAVTVTAAGPLGQLSGVAGSRLLGSSSASPAARRARTNSRSDNRFR
jgi:4'-phosphopantetheinyl transferase